MHTTGTSDLAQIEERVYQSIWEDGLIDIFVGLALFLIGVFWIGQDSAYGSFVAPVLVPFWVAARKRISEPRIGVVNFSTERVSKENKKLLGLFLFGVLTLALGVGWYVLGPPGGTIRPQGVVSITAGLPAALLAIPAVIVAFAFGLSRFFAYAFVLFVSAVPVIFFDLRPGWAFLPSGVFAVIVGASLLARFVRKYPITD